MIAIYGIFHLLILNKTLHGSFESTFSCALVRDGNFATSALKTRSGHFKLWDFLELSRTGIVLDSVLALSENDFNYSEDNFFSIHVKG